MEERFDTPHRQNNAVPRFAVTIIGVTDFSVFGVAFFLFCVQLIFDQNWLQDVQGNIPRKD